MKTNAIIRIILYSLVLVLLLGILIIGLSVDLFSFQFGASDPLDQELTSGTTSFDARRVSKIKLDWAAGSVTLKAGEPQGGTGDISLQAAPDDEKYPVTYEIVGDTLYVSYTNANFGITFDSIPKKDLIIWVPEVWICDQLEIDGAALELNMENLTVGTLDIDGAACQINFYGAVDTVSCDGAACELDMYCTERPSKIDIDGAACELDLTLPEDCGFRVEMNGLSCHFSSSLPCTQSDGVTRYGDEHCQITADGISCEITIGIPN